MFQKKPPDLNFGGFYGVNFPYIALKPYRNRNTFRTLPVQDTTKAGWTVAPRVKCTVKNEGTADVNLEFIATADSWNDYLNTNPFAESSKKMLASGTDESFEFTEFDWNTDKLNEEADKVAFGEISSPENEHSNTFELRITEVE